MREWLERISRRLAAAGNAIRAASRGRVGSVPAALVAGVALAVVLAGTWVLVVMVSAPGGPASAPGGPGSAPGGPGSAPGGPGSVPGAAGQADQEVIQPVPVSAAQLAKLPRATTYATINDAPSDPAPFAVTAGVVVHPLARQVVYAGPGKQPVAVLPTKQVGSPTWVPVVQTSPGWERVLLPSRPNRSSGWLFTAGKAGSLLVTRSTPYLLRVRTDARKLTVAEAGKSLGTWTVAVGKPGTPTPTGRTFLLALLAPVHPTYSPLILPLGTHSNTLSTFGGGPGTVALHGWPSPAVFGHAVSHGCIRVPTAALRILAKIPLGSIVLITR